MAAKNRILTVLLASAFMIGGCDMKTHSSVHDPAAMGPQAKIMQTADSSWIVSTGAPVEHTLPAQDGGDKATTERLNMLEHQVATMQNYMNTMMPVLTRLVAVQTDIQGMLARLQTTGGVPAGAVPPGAMAPVAPPVTTDPPAQHEPVPMMATPPSDPQPLSSAPPPPDAATMPAATSTTSTTTTTTTIPAPAPAPQSAATPVPPPPPSDTADAGGPTIKDVRLGEHPDKTRIVLDLSNKADYSQTIDNTGHVLTIDVKDGAWKGSPAATQIANSPLLSSWQATPDGQGGTRIVMQLRKSAKVAAAQTLPASGDQDARVVIDLTAL